jgi:hypothetical protein
LFYLWYLSIQSFAGCSLIIKNYTWDCWGTISCKPILWCSKCHPLITGNWWLNDNVGESISSSALTWQHADIRTLQHKGPECLHMPKDIKFHYNNYTKGHHIYKVEFWKGEFGENPIFEHIYIQNYWSWDSNLQPQVVIPKTLTFIFLVLFIHFFLIFNIKGIQKMISSQSSALLLIFFKKGLGKLLKGNNLL